LSQAIERSYGSVLAISALVLPLEG
jgi:hypothetical protein